MSIVHYVNRPGPFPLEPVVDLLKNEASGFAIDFVSGKAFARGEPGFLPRDINGFLSYPSPSTKYVRDAGGVLVPGTTMRCDHDKEGNPLGLLIEEQRTNFVLTSAGNTATVGVVGSGGALPTGWGIPLNQGLTIEVVANDVDPGIGGCRIRFHGTPATSGLVRVQVCRGVGRAETDPAVIHSIHARGVSGSLNNVTDILLALVNTSGSSIEFDPFDGAESLGHARRVSDTAAGVSSSLTIRQEFRFRVAAGMPVDFTLDIGGSQFEEGAFPTSYIATGESQVTRSADDIFLSVANFPFNQENGTLLVEASLFAPDLGITTYGAAAPVATLTRSTTDVRGQYGIGRSDSGTREYRAHSYIRNFIGSTIIEGENGSFPKDTLSKMALSKSGERFALLSNGIMCGEVNQAGAFDIIWLNIGSTFARNQRLNGHIKSLVYVPRALSDSELIARTMP